MDNRLITKKITEILNLKNSIDLNASLKNVYGIDSLQIVQLVIDLEEEFSIELDDEDLLFENYENINTIAKMIESKLKTDNLLNSP